MLILPPDTETSVNAIPDPERLPHEPQSEQSTAQLPPQFPQRRKPHAARQPTPNRATPKRAKLSESRVNSSDDDDSQLEQSSHEESRRDISGDDGALRHKAPNGAESSPRPRGTTPLAPTAESHESNKPKAPAAKRGARATRKKRNPAGRFTSSKDA